MGMRGRQRDGFEPMDIWNRIDWMKGLIVVGAIMVAADLGRSVRAFAANLPQDVVKRAEPQKELRSRDVDAERRLLEDLSSALDTDSEDGDYSRVDRELAAAFQRFGLELDKGDPKEMGRTTRRASRDCGDCGGDR